MSCDSTGTLPWLPNLQWQDLVDVYWNHVWHGGRAALEKPWERGICGGWLLKNTALRYAVDPSQFLRDKCKNLH